MKKIMHRLGVLGVSVAIFGVTLATALTALTASADPLSTQAGVPQMSAEYVIYVGDGCPHCAKVEAHIDDEGYMDIFDIEYKEIYHNSDNAAEFGKVADGLGIGLFERGVPLMVAHGEYFIGDKLIVEYLDDRYDEWLEAGGGTVDGGDGGDGGFDPGTTDSARKLTIPLVIGAALVDAINPCAFAVLIILLTTILAGGVKRKALYAGLMFSLAIFLSYLAMGLGLYGVVATAGVSLLFMKFIGGLAILLGLFNLKDVFFYGKGFIMEVPMSWRPKMKAILRSATSPIGAFAIGVLISLFLLPCTSGPYIVIISLLGQKDMFWEAVRLLVLYNVIFVTPMLFITFAVYKGFSVERAEEMRQKRLKVLHLIAGVLLLVMGALILGGYV